MRALKIVCLVAALTARAGFPDELEASVVPGETVVIRVLGLPAAADECPVTLPPVVEDCDASPDPQEVDKSTWPTIIAVAPWTFFLTLPVVLEGEVPMPDLLVFTDRRLSGTTVDRSFTEVRSGGGLTCQRVSRCQECGVYVATPAYTINRCQLLLSDAEMALYATAVSWQVCTTDTGDKGDREIACSHVAVAGGQ